MKELWRKKYFDHRKLVIKSKNYITWIKLEEYWGRIRLTDGYGVVDEYYNNIDQALDRISKLIRKGE